MNIMAVPVQPPRIHGWIYFELGFGFEDPGVLEVGGRLITGALFEVGTAFNRGTAFEPGVAFEPWAEGTGMIG